MDEKTFFEHEDVKVTNSRFISGTQTFAMSNVTSVKALTERPSRVFGVITVMFGLLMALYGQIAVGVLIAAAAGAFLYFQKTTYHIMLNTSGGETSALKTHQLDYITQVVAAINNAIVHRG